MLSLEEFIIEVYCCVDDHLRAISQGKRFRSRGFEPALSDAEVITMEVVGEFLGIDTDKGIFEYFHRHWFHFFPNLGSRTTWLRHGANLWYWKQKLQQMLSKKLNAFSDQVHLVDGLPIPVCRFKRALFSNVFRGEAAYGYCASKGEKFYGFRGHLLISLSGAITSFSLTAANVDERDALRELLQGIRGLLIGDKGYISAALHEELLSQGIDLETALRENMEDDRDPRFVKLLVSLRRQIETVIGQLCERFHIERVRARDLWHITSRLYRKLLGHTVALFINHLHGSEEPLQFEGLVEA
ncbi:IS982 family transposase [Desulforhabdus sp. TSK]|uniref:IS982 family transposase n=1 Tax=Desulforhabdus sp. TSK TaxID=2925014 RepID=UPI001FC80CE2|nr:IS982 family transposase [Desulforhabdus sp. TSK]GKT10885.1 transposase [Desulforhabdus sp. TSK]